MNYEDTDWDGDDYEDDYYEDDTVACPDCGGELYEDADACPHCGCYLHHGHYAGGWDPWWTFGGALSEWSPLWLFLAMVGVIAVCFSLMMIPG